MLLDAWGQEPHTVIAGDMNAEPGTREIARFEGAGLENADDNSGSEGALTWPSDNPKVQIDWIFGTPDVDFQSFDVPPTTASDHLPLVVTLSLSDG